MLFFHHIFPIDKCKFKCKLLTQFSLQDFPEDQTLKSMRFLKYFQSVFKKIRSHQLKSSEASEITLHLTDWTIKPFSFMTIDGKKG